MNVLTIYLLHVLLDGAFHGIEVGRVAIYTMLQDYENGRLILDSKLDWRFPIKKSGELWCEMLTL